MVSYAEFMERLTKLNKEVNDYFANLIRKNKYPITSIELLLLMRLNVDREITPQEVASKGSGLFNHLKFLLNSLENKKLISIKAKSNNDLNSSINLNPVSKTIIKSFDNMTIPDTILKNLEDLELFVKTYQSK